MWTLPDTACCVRSQRSLVSTRIPQRPTAVPASRRWWEAFEVGPFQGDGEFWKHGKLHVGKFLHRRLFLGLKSLLNWALLYGALSWPAEVAVFAVKTLTDQNSIQEEIKSRLKLGNAWYYSVKNLLSSRLLPKSLKIKIYRTIILPVVLYGCETWSLTLREERRLRVFENRVLRRVFGPKRDEVTGEWRKLHKFSWMICTPYPILFGW